MNNNGATFFNSQSEATNAMMNRIGMMNNNMMPNNNMIHNNTMSNNNLNNNITNNENDDLDDTNETTYEDSQQKAIDQAEAYELFPDNKDEEFHIEASDDNNTINIKKLFNNQAGLKQMMQDNERLLFKKILEIMWHIQNINESIKILKKKQKKEDQNASRNNNENNNNNNNLYNQSNSNTNNNAANINSGEGLLLVNVIDL